MDPQLILHGHYLPLLHFLGKLLLLKVVLAELIIARGVLLEVVLLEPLHYVVVHILLYYGPINAQDYRVFVHLYLLLPGMHLVYQLTHPYQVLLAELNPMLVLFG